ncbi:hypothetical protein Pecwa_3854 [Pectobacterium parmentieri WPP163]|nr:hypothetical protein Pecwa_3854 [Pectobacterium parmentieri WPP163]
MAFIPLTIKLFCLPDVVSIPNARYDAALAAKMGTYPHTMAGNNT